MAMPVPHEVDDVGDPQDEAHDDGLQLDGRLLQLLQEARQ